MPWTVGWYEDDEQTEATFYGHGRELEQAIRNCVREAERARDESAERLLAIRDEVER